MLRSRAVASILAALISSVGCSQGESSSSGAGGSASSMSSGAGGQGGMASTGSLASSSSAASSSSTAASSSATASSSSSASASSSSSTGASSSTASSSSGMALPENCTNGVDDNGDGLVDCADPTCTAGFTCTPNPPGGWNGPVALYDGPPANKPMCPADHPNSAYQGSSGIIPTPAMCSACACGAPQVTCTPSIVDLDSDALCAMSVGSLVQPPVNACAPIAPPGSASFAKIPPPNGSAGACAPSGGAATLPPPDWQTAGLACAGGGIGAGCPAKTECVPRAAAPFAPSLCVWRAGDQACPVDYPNKHLYTDTVMDSRGCSACACGAGVPVCTGNTSIYSSSNCTGAHANVPNDGTCTLINGGASMKVSVTGTGSCPASGGMPIGTIVEGAVHTTVCCAP